MTEEAVQTQIEFYLSDSNLPFDKFLFSRWSDSFNNPSEAVLSTPVPSAETLASVSVAAPQNNKHDSFYLGWIPLSQLTSFKRMQPYLQAPPEGLGGIDQIAEALQSRKLIQVYQMGKENPTWYIRRSTPLKRPEDVMQRSLYVKGFPVATAEDDSEESKQTIKDQELELQKKLEDWIRSLNIGELKALRMRREDKAPPAGSNGVPMKGRGVFKGSVFVEFASAESVAKYLTLDPKPTWEGAELEAMSKGDYVEMKRKIYAPDSKPADASVPRNPFAKSKNAFNAWAEKLISSEGVPLPVAKETDSRKRKAQDDEDNKKERKVIFDGVTFTAKRTGDKIEIVDEENIGKGEGGWPANRILKFSVSKKDGSFEGAEAGDRFNALELKSKIIPIHKVGFVNVFEPKQEEKKELVSAFGQKLSTPPTVATTTATVKEGEASYPLKGQVSFKETVTDEILEKLKADLGNLEGRKLVWERGTEAEERSHVISRARYHAEQAFGMYGSSDNRGGRGGRGGGRGGNRGGRGGHRGGRGGHQNKRPRRD